MKVGGFFIQSLFLQIFPSWKLTFIDVGQGDSILLETPSRRHFLFDTGNGGKKNDAGNKIIPYLRHSGIRSKESTSPINGFAPLTGLN